MVALGWALTALAPMPWSVIQRINSLLLGTGLFSHWGLPVTCESQGRDHVQGHMVVGKTGNVGCIATAHDGTVLLGLEDHGVLL